MNTIGLTSFVIGVVLLLAALLGTGIKIVQVDLPKFEKRQRIIAGITGTVLVVFGLADGKLPSLQLANTASATPMVATNPDGTSIPVTAATNCFSDVPADNLHTLIVAPDRRSDYKFFYGTPREEVIAFQWSDGKSIMGGMKLRTMQSEIGFDIISVVDGACNPVESYRNLTRTDVPKDKPISYDTFRYEVGARIFIMDVAYTGDQRLSIRVRQLGSENASARLHSHA
jgi:hypothetical protein